MISAMEILALVVSVAALAVSVFNSRYACRSAKAAERSAEAAVRSVEHLVERDKPKGAVFRSFSSGGDAAVIVANTGAVPFTVREVGMGGVPFAYGFGERVLDRAVVRDVPAGGSASFAHPVGFSGRGPAYAVLADGTVLQEDAPDR